MTKSKSSTKANETQNSDDEGELSFKEFTKILHGRSKAAKDKVIERMLREWCRFGGAVTSKVSAFYIDRDCSVHIAFGQTDEYCVRFSLDHNVINLHHWDSRDDLLLDRDAFVIAFNNEVAKLFKPLTTERGKKQLNDHLTETWSKWQALNWLSCVADDLAHCKAKHK